VWRAARAVVSRSQWTNVNTDASAGSHSPGGNGSKPIGSQPPSRKAFPKRCHIVRVARGTESPKSDTMRTGVLGGGSCKALRLALRSSPANGITAGGQPANDLTCRRSGPITVRKLRTSTFTSIRNGSRPGPVSTKTLTPRAMLSPRRRGQCTSGAASARIAIAFSTSTLSSGLSVASSALSTPRTVRRGNSGSGGATGRGALAAKAFTVRSQAGTTRAVCCGS
jgi:hypothetical protein